MRTDKMPTAVLYSKEDALKFLKDRPEVDRVYPLTPDARAELLDIETPVLDPLDYFTDYSHCRVLARVRRIENHLHLILYKEEKLSDASKETFRGLFHLLACKVLYLWYALRMTGPWLVRVGKGWEKTAELAVAHRLLIHEINRSDKGVFSLVTKRFSVFPRFTGIINSLTVNLLNGKKCIVTTGLKRLSKEIQEYSPDCYVLRIKGSYERDFLLSLWQLVRLMVKGTRDITLVSSPHAEQQVRQRVDNLLDEIEDPVLQNARKIMEDNLKAAVFYTESLRQGTDKLFEMLKPKALVAHHFRWLDAAVAGAAAVKNQTPSVLISHGSHIVNENSAAEYEHREVAHGLLLSPLASETIVQSPQAEKAAAKFRSQLKRRSYQPIMWGHRNSNGQLVKTNSVQTILYAGTYKVLGGRPWIYETSNEFLNGLKDLVHAVGRLENAHLIFRIRSNRECSVESLRRLLPSARNYEIKTTGNFTEDLCRADLLISYSSTTIEEALYARTPVGLFGGSDRYRHLPGSNQMPTDTSRNAVYHLSRDNLSSMLQAILNVHKGQPLTDEQLKDYVWPKSVPGREEFIKRILYDLEF